MKPSRRASDTLRAVDGVLQTHLGEGTVSGRALANLALAMATEYSGADRGVLLLDEGRGLEPVLKLGRDLRALPAEDEAYDAELAGRAATSRAVASAAGRIAAPVVLGDFVAGMICLESDAGALDPEIAELAAGVAMRVAAVLRSASLVDELARRTRTIETLEALGACLAARNLGAEQFERAVEAAARATESPEAILSLCGDDNQPPQIFVRGTDQEALERLGAALGERLGRAGGAEEARRALREEDRAPALFEALATEPLALAGGASDEPAGFLLVRRPDGPAYGDADRSVFRALGHLLAGAMARADYLRRAAEDPLTATGSRLALQLRLAEAEARALKDGEAYSLILLDVDQFKRINDTSGHLEGDAVLKDLADALRARLRAHDFVARFGGDEFVIILPGTGTEEAGRVAEALRDVAAGRTFGKRESRISISMGTATFPLHAASWGELLRLADEALYASKSGGRDRVTGA